MILWNKIKEAMLKKPLGALREGERKMSYGEIVDFVEDFSKKLSRERCIAILCGSEMSEAMALLSCFCADVVAVPLSAKYGKKHCDRILDTVGPTAIITDAQGDLEIFPLPHPTYMEPDDRPALIMCTSGTKGTPKGVMLSEKNILTNISDICEYFDINERDRILICRPLYHSAVLVGELLVSLIKGLDIYFYSDEFNPVHLLRMISANKITVFGGTPTLIGMLVRFLRRDEKLPLRVICISGECMGIDTARRIQKAFEEAEIYHVYGLTEASPRVCYLPPSSFREYPDCVGIPLASVEIKIIKEEGDIAQTGEVGELWVQGDNVMLGYYGAPQETQRVLRDGWLCTGDVARLNDAGYISIKGRRDDMMIRAGVNIYPQEIENALLCDGRVREVIAYKIDDEIMGARIGLKISGSFESVEDVKKLCTKMLPSYQMPSVIELEDELEKNGSGKVIRRKKYGD